MRRSAHFALTTLLLASTPRAALAQLDTATVIGTVTDSQNQVVPDVPITTRNIATGFTRAVVSDLAGRYRIAALPPGEYELTAGLPGFVTVARTGIVLMLGSEHIVNIQLQPAGVTELVSVIADVPVIETVNAVVRASFNRSQLDLLPLAGRDFEALLRLVPGGRENNGSIGFAGSRGRSNHWHIDGVDNANDITGYSRQTPPLDSIQEVQVLVNGFKAEYGQASGGIVNAVTRSGTNVRHGGGFFLYRSRDMMSDSPYADRTLPREQYRRVQFGATFGGPIRRDTLHHFVAYERDDQVLSVSSARTLPSSAAPFSAATRQFLAQNNIDLGLFGAGGAQRHGRPEFIDVHKLSARVDHQMNRYALTARYLFDSATEPSGFGGTLFDFNGSTGRSRRHYTAINHKWTSDASRLNEAYVQIGTSFTDVAANFPSLQNVIVSGAFSLGGSMEHPQRRTDYTYQLVENFTWFRSGRMGEHAIKTGAQVKFFRSDGFLDANFRGTWTFPTLQAFINGMPSRFTQRRGDTALKLPNDVYGFYLQDDWHPAPGLTLNLGLRYDYETGKTEALRDVTGEPGSGISRDRNNISPRFGFSWAPGNSTKHAIYGGAGIYYDQIILSIQANARFTPPKVIGIQIDNPAWPDPFLGGSVQVPPPSLSIVDPDLVTPYNRNWHVGYRRELLPDLGLDVSFLASRGFNHVGAMSINAGTPGSANIFGVGAVRPDPNFSSKLLYTNFGEIKYKGLVLDLTKRFSRNVQGTVNYTLSRTEDNAYTFMSDIFYPERPDLNWGPSVGDRRHRIEAHTEIVFPAGIQAGLVFEYRSELPLDIIAGGRDLNGDGITFEWPHEAVCRTISCTGFRYSRNSVRELSTVEANRLRALFGLPAIERFEDNPKYVNVDLTVEKRVRLGRHAIGARIEAFNVFNLPQRRFTDESIGLSATQQLNILSPLFGQYLRVEQPRAVQATLHYDF